MARTSRERAEDVGAGSFPLCGGKKTQSHFDHGAGPRQPNREPRRKRRVGQPPQFPARPLLLPAIASAGRYSGPGAPMAAAIVS